MPIVGRFGGTTGSPYIAGRLYLPRLNLSGDISFLMDTGADCSVIMPADGRRLSIPFDQLRGDRECAGIGGITHLYEEGAVLVFSEPGVALYAYDLPVDIMPDDPEMTGVPSLLGRDVLNRWRITYDPSGVGLKINVRTADRIFDLSRR